MNRCEEDREYSLTVLFGAVVRRLLTIILCAIITSVLFLMIVDASSLQESSEESYKAKIEAYEKEYSFYSTELSFLKEYQQSLIEENNDNTTAIDLVILSERIIELEKKLSEKGIPSRSNKYSSKNCIILGGFAGGFLSLVFVLISFISSNPIALSYDAEKRFRAPCIGSFYTTSFSFENVAAKIIGERVFKDEESTIEMIRNGLINYLSVFEKGARIAVISSILDKKTKKKAEILCKIIDECGFSTVYIPEASQNPDTIKLIQNCDSVVFLERQWKSKWMYISSNISLVNRLSKRIVGFVIC